MKRLTVFTPTYNRAHTIGRVYESLLSQTFKDFEWIIVDDGSSDNTKKIVADFISEKKINIKYYYQTNKGKHIATNFALSKTDTELFIIADSDDSFLPNSFEILVNAWDKLPSYKKRYFKGVICRAFDHDTGKPIGTDFPYEVFDSTDEETYFKYKLRNEKWNLTRTDVFKEFKFPEISNAHFYPETVIWQLMSKKYKTRYINIPLREYYNDAENSIIFGKKSVRYVENVHLWIHFINNEFKYFSYYPMRFIQSFVGLSRDGILNGYSFFKIISIPNSVLKKFLCFIFFPAGWVLASMCKRKNN